MTGTDVAATGLYLSGGAGTGTGNGGNISLNVYPPGLTSGSTLNASQPAFFASGVSGYTEVGGVDTPAAGTSTWAGSDVKAGVTDGGGGLVIIRGGLGTGSGNPGAAQMRMAIGANGVNLAATLFANLGTPPANGFIAYCSDCTKATPCASGGTGALAKRLAGVWDCN
jgi:hypothetical protein